MVRRIVGRDALQRLAIVADRAERLNELRRLDNRPKLVGPVRDPIPERLQPRSVRMPYPAADVDLAGLEMEVAAAGMDRVRVRATGRLVDAIPGPHEARGQMGLVRRFVLAEPRIAVDPERRLHGIRVQR